MNKLIAPILVKILLGVQLFALCGCELAAQQARISTSTTAQTQRLNVLLIYVDDLGYGDLASYGHPVIQTPALDKLAQQGIRFTQYYAPSALCSPSRAGLLTGRHPYRSGIESWIPGNSGIFLPAAEVTLAEVLRAQGYQTALVGKWHLNSSLADSAEPQPLDQGFDYAYGHNAFQLPTNRNPTNIFRNGKQLPPQVGYTAQLYADDAIEWLNARDAQAPFFLMLSMAEPHTSIENPPEYNQRYAQYTRGVIRPIPSGQPQPPKDLLVPRGPGEYYANITYMDTHIGRVLDELDRLQLAKQTLVVFASDNGPVTNDWIAWWEVNAHGDTGGLRGRKHRVYEGGIRVPAMIRLPGRVEPGSETDELVVGMDLFTTIAAYTGAEVPMDRPIDGIDVSPALSGRKLPSRALVWALESDAPLAFAVRRDHWKLLLDKSAQPKELYNLAADPLELFNLINEQTAQRDALQASFIEWRDAVAADPIRRQSSASVVRRGVTLVMSGSE